MTTTRRLSLAYLALTAGLAVLFALNLFWGSVELTPGAVAAALLGRGGDALAVGIVLQLRLPRAVMVVLLGAALSAAGYLLQTFFANPIAGPFVMGVSSGAKLAVALTMVVFLQRGLLTGSATLIIAAFAGAMAAMAFVLVVARRVPRMSILVICGIMIGYICSAITDIVVTFAQDSNIVNLHNWSMGSFSGMTWANVGAAACVVLPALAAAFLLSKPMAAYQMGESYARSVGVPVRAFSTALVLLSSLLSACVTAFAGPISFVGIAVPHLVKSLLGLLHSSSQGVGELADFLMGFAMLLPAGLIYQRNKTRKGALIGMAVGGVIILVVGVNNPNLGLSGAWEGIRLVFGGLFSTGRTAAGRIADGVADEEQHEGYHIHQNRRAQHARGCGLYLDLVAHGGAYGVPGFDPYFRGVVAYLTAAAVVAAGRAAQDLDLGLFGAGQFFNYCILSQAAAPPNYEP